MFAQVTLISGFQRPLTYKIPQELHNLVIKGSMVTVPLRNRLVPAIVTAKFHSLKKATSFDIKEINQVIPFPDDKNYALFIKKTAHFYFLPEWQLYHRLHNFLEKPSLKQKQPLLHANTHKQTTVILTDEQTTIVTALLKNLGKPTYQASLLHGVTGSGKTEIYKRLIDTCIGQNKSVIMLLPEVTLSMQFEYRLKQEMPHIDIAGFHSASKPSEKKAVWSNLVNSKPMLLLGVHLPILLPTTNLGLIIVDEEHETGFQEKKHPKMNSKDIALLKAYTYKIPILLGSATPSISSLQQVYKKKWDFYQLTKRFSGKFPVIKQVNLLDKTGKKRRQFWISGQLEHEIAQRLLKKEQVIIFLNRRGYSFFLQCTACGFIFECPNCSVSLTPHMSPRDPSQAILQCHYCDYQCSMPRTCTDCKGRDFLKKGVGTQQVVQILKNLFPHASVERADMDSTTKKRSWQQTVREFEQGNIDILVGTKTITKGYHFPKVTLVGILWADLTLHFPQYDAAETTLHQLIQVAGRAGRYLENSTVILQVMQSHPIFSYVTETKYLRYANIELMKRKETNYPPFCKFICLEIRHAKEDTVDKDAENIAEFLLNKIEKQKLPVRLLGPAMPPVQRIYKTEIRHVFLKSPHFRAAHEIISDVLKQKWDSKVFVVISQ